MPVVLAMTTLLTATGHHGHNTTAHHGLHGPTIRTGPSTILLGLRHGRHTRRGRAVGLLIRLTHGLIHGRLHGHRTPHGRHTVLRGLHSGLDHGHPTHLGHHITTAIHGLRDTILIGVLHGHHITRGLLTTTRGLLIGHHLGLLGWDQPTGQRPILGTTKS
jgi:hypothetical protein